MDSTLLSVEQSEGKTSELTHEGLASGGKGGGGGGGFICNIESTWKSIRAFGSTVPTVLRKFA
jgi:hypothetical protein